MEWLTGWLNPSRRVVLPITLPIGRVILQYWPGKVILPQEGENVRSNPPWRKLENSRLWIYSHAEWRNIVEATARLGVSIGQDGLSAWLSARAREAEESNRSRT